MWAIKKFKEDSILINLIEAFQKWISRFNNKTVKHKNYLILFNYFKQIINLKKINNVEINF